MSCGAVQDANTRYGILYAGLHTQADGYWSADAAGRWCTFYTASGDRVDASASGYYTNFILMDRSDPNNTILLNPMPPPPTCFTPDTLILMADGSEKPIAAMNVGDEVLGSDGGVNRVTAIEQPILGCRQLYAINDERYFITAEHPLMTDSGWKSVDPAATAAENADLVVGRLYAGDCLMMLAEEFIPMMGRGSSSSVAVLPRLAGVPLRRLDAKTADPSMILYNLLLDGSHSYFANGFLAHNKGH